MLSLSNIKFSIKYKIIGIILVVTVLTVGIGFTISTLKSIDNYKNDLINNITINAKLTGEYCITALAFEDKNGANDIINKLKTIPQIENVILYDIEENIFTSFFNKPEDFTHVKTGEDETVFERNYLQVTETIEYDNVIYGRIHIEASTEILNNQIRDMIILYALIYIALLFAAYVLANSLQKIISKPILKLANFTDKISKEKKYGVRLEKLGKDEIGMLYENFNGMLDQIERTQKHLKESEFKYSSLVENSTDGIIIIQDGKVVFTNQKTANIVGGKIENIIGSDLLDYTSPNYKRLVEDRYKKRIKGEEVPNQYESELVHKDGYYIPVEISGKLIEYENRPAIMGILRDITERKKADKLRIEKEAAEASNKSKS